MQITKDGVTVAKAIEFKDRYMNLGASLIKQVASNTNDVAGDGTTTATVLTRAILREGLKSVAAGMNPMDLRRGITKAVDHVVSELKARAKMISTAEEIAQVCTWSSPPASRMLLILLGCLLVLRPTIPVGLDCHMAPGVGPVFCVLFSMNLHCVAIAPCAAWPHKG